MSSCSHNLGDEKVFIFHAILQRVCDSKNVKNHCSLRIRDQIFLPSFALLLHLLYCQGVCVGGGRDLNLFMMRKIHFCLEMELKKNSLLNAMTLSYNAIKFALQ